MKNLLLGDLLFHTEHGIEPSVAGRRVRYLGALLIVLRIAMESNHLHILLILCGRRSARRVCTFMKKSGDEVVFQEEGLGNAWSVCTYLSLSISIPMQSVFEIDSYHLTLKLGSREVYRHIKVDNIFVTVLATAGPQFTHARRSLLPQGKPRSE